MLTYSSLREIQKKEVEGGALVELGDDFYSQALELINAKKQEAKTGDMLSVREFENIKRILSIIQAKREEKIVLMALRSEKSHIGLTKEEKETFLRVQQLISEHRGKIIMSDRKITPVQRVEILQDVGEYKGADKKVYGPFKLGEEHVLPKEEADWLLKEKMAKQTI